MKLHSALVALMLLRICISTSKTIFFNSILGLLSGIKSQKFVFRFWADLQI